MSSYYKTLPSLLMSQSQLSPAERQAIEWQAILSSDLVNEHQRHEFAEWLNESTDNQNAWQAINQFWTGLDKLTWADINNKQRCPTLTLKPSLAVKQRPTYYKIGLAMAASVLLLVANIRQQLDFYLADYHCNAGQQQQISLADGSKILLNTESALSVNFSEHQRLITLHQGEGYFKVAADSSRPFVVKTDAGQVQALGTAFDVKQQQQEVSVTVFEHAVKITTTSGEQKDKLLESEQIIFTRDGFKALNHANLQRAAAWHQQIMVFQDKPLAEVVAELDRYRPGKIMIIGDAVKKLPITGVFGIADSDIALQTLQQSLPVKITKFTNNLIIISTK